MEEKLLGIAARVAKPLALASVIVIVLYLIYRQIIDLPIYSQLSEENTSELLASIVNSIFILALVGLVLGVASYLYSSLLASRRPQPKPNLVLKDASEDREFSPSHSKEHQDDRVQ